MVAPVLYQAVQTISLKKQYLYSLNSALLCYIHWWEWEDFCFVCALTFDFSLDLGGTRTWSIKWLRTWSIKSIIYRFPNTASHNKIERRIWMELGGGRIQLSLIVLSVMFNYAGLVARWKACLNPKSSLISLGAISMDDY